MPTYEYRCQYCHELTEEFQRMSDAPLTHCPHCGKEGLVRVVSGGAGVLYKGEGWYVTDYSKKSAGGKQDTPESEKSTKPTTSKPVTTDKPATPAKETPTTTDTSKTAPAKK